MRNAETYLILVGLIVLTAFSVVFAAAEMSYTIRSSMDSLGRFGFFMISNYF